MSETKTLFHHRRNIFKIKETYYFLSVGRSVGLFVGWSVCRLVPNEFLDSLELAKLKKLIEHRKEHFKNHFKQHFEDHLKEHLKGPLRSTSRSTSKAVQKPLKGHLKEQFQDNFNDHFKEDFEEHFKKTSLEAL